MLISLDIVDLVDTVDDMSVATLKKPSAPKSLPMKVGRPKRPFQRPQAQFHSPQAGARIPAKPAPAVGALEAALEKLRENTQIHAAPTDEELSDLIVEILRFSPAAAARVNAKLSVDSAMPATDPREAGLALVRQMQRVEGGAWTGTQLRAQFELSAATLHRRRAEHRIMYWRDAQGGFLYPKWQFTPVGALLPGMQKVLQTFRSSDEWRLMRYFLAPRQQLAGLSPLTLLRRGETDKVVAHAHVHGQENTW